MWMEERTSRSSMSNPQFSMCCQEGKVDLPLLPHTPPTLQELLNGEHDFANIKFRDMIRSYNNMLAFTSIGGKIDYSVMDGRGPYTFRIHGANYHKIGSLLPEAGRQPKYAQLYILDTEVEIENRLRIIHSNEQSRRNMESILRMLQTMLDDINPYVSVFRTAREVLASNSMMDLRIKILESRSRRQYIRPTGNEIAALMVGDGTNDENGRDIILHTRSGPLRRVSETHPSYMPLQYPLLFSFGEDGWTNSIPYRVNHSRAHKRDCISIREFCAYRLQFREEEGKTLLQSGKLFQQYDVDSYAAIEAERIQYVRHNKKKFRIDVIQGLEDAVTAGESNAAAIGRRYILPSSFYGGPRHMYQNYQDAMAICRTLGPPDYFITFTCNPNWPEIKEALRSFPNQKVEDRPDIVARVFHIKMKQFLKDIKKVIFKKVISGKNIFY